ncbi:MAG: DNA-processing protein DprA [Lachnospiraceae bacterium]|nr:DNA-processing protein DprA [Lachnospiraceae bacterium]
MEKQSMNYREAQRKRHEIWHGFASFCVTPKMQDGILAYFETPECALASSGKEWDSFFVLAESLGFTSGEKEKIFEVLKRDHDKEYDKVEQAGIGFVTQEDSGYPEKLKTLFSAPRFFYYKGTLPGEEPVLAIIGARNCSHYGSDTAWKIAKELAEQGVGVVSGLAYGVDKAAHDGTLAGGGKTYAVLGCGPDVCYPQNHIRTYEMILSTGGGILSEYPPGTRPLSCFFPQRNRIIAGLSDGILVTEARKKSGTLITVSFGLEFGKNIYAVPGRIDDVLSEGCNYLLKEGAKPVTCGRDLLEDMDIRVKRKKKGAKTATPDLSEEEAKVYDSLNYHLKHMDELVEKTGLLPWQLASVLDNLLQKGCIKRQGQAYYAKATE